MKVKRDIITSVGLTVLYEPDEPQTAVVDLVFVAGLGGHPIKTWLYTPPSSTPSTPPSTKIPRLVRTPSKGKLVRKASSLKSTSKLTLDALISNEEKPREPDLSVYWPLDLLPESCPNTRILTWGCHTIVSNGSMPRNQNDIFDHSQDLLQELTLIRDETNSVGRPIIFMAHSLGGVIVKEVLRRSESDPESHMKALLPSTAGIIFLACPHRASEQAKLSDAVKSMASATLQLSAGDPVLQDITGAKGFQLDLGREAFVRMWNDYNFKVKTYQEKQALKLKVSSGTLEMAIRRESSFIGDPREHAETLDANHLDICRFASAAEVNFKSLVATLALYIRDEVNRLHVLSYKEKECLKALAPSGLGIKETQPTASYPGTCLWLYDIPEFRAWHHRKQGAKSKVLWIKGTPGSGKTVLLKSLRNRVEKQWAANGSTFIWSVAEGQDLESIFFLPTQTRKYAPNPAGVYRSLLGQLFKQDPRLRKAMLSMYKRNRRADEPFNDGQVVSFFVDDYIDQTIQTPVKRTFIFVDVADDCGVLYVQDLIYYLSRMARNSDFSICVASNHHMSSPGGDAIEVVMKEHNGDDIWRYINLNLIAEWEERNVTVHKIAAKARGVFLWAEIVVNILNAAIDEGAMQDLIEETVSELPSDIEHLYEWILGTLSPEEKGETLILMQWVILASEPLRLNDLRVAIRLTKTWSPENSKPYMAFDVGQPMAMRDIRNPSSSEFDTPYQFHRWIRNRSVGLLELKPEAKDGVISEPLGLQRVQVIHETVRTFFLTGRGFQCLAGAKVAEDGEFADVSHYAMLHACLTYLNITDLQPLGHGGLPVAPMPHDESKYWRKNVHDQRNLVMSSYPFLQYAVDNVLYHLLSPRYFRYFLPHRDLIRALGANKCRVWRRWTALLGESDPDAILRKSETAQDFLSPVYGVRYRLERVFRVLNKMSADATPVTSRSPLSPQSGFSGFWSPKSVSSKASSLSLRALYINSPLTPMSPGPQKPNTSPLSPK